MYLSKKIVILDKDEKILEVLDIGLPQDLSKENEERELKRSVAFSLANLGIEEFTSYKEVPDEGLYLKDTLLKDYDENGKQINTSVNTETTNKIDKPVVEKKMIHSYEISITKKKYKEFVKLFSFDSPLNKEMFKIVLDSSSLESKVYFFNEQSAKVLWFTGDKMVKTFIKKGFIEDLKVCPYRSSIFDKKCLGEKCMFYKIENSVGKCSRS